MFCVSLVWFGSVWSSGITVAVKEIGSVVTWGTIQYFSELPWFLCLILSPEDFDGYTAPSSRGVTSDPEDFDGYTAPSSRGVMSDPEDYDACLAQSPRGVIQKFQKILMGVRLRRHVGLFEAPEDSDGCTAPSSRGEMSDPEDYDACSAPSSRGVIQSSRRF